MSRKRTKKKELDRITMLAKKLGMNVEKVLEEVPLTDIGQDAIHRKSLEAESVLFYVETKGKGFTQKNCKGCGGAFLHTYLAVAYCSDECRAFALAEMGIIWNFHLKSDSQRWNAKNNGFVPKVIGVEATQALKDSGNFFND